MKTGDKLPNGAVVLLEKSGVILASQISVQPYVTWRWDGVNPKSTTWGNYHTSIAKAAMDFEARCVREEKTRALR
jgi:hypothetical protein